jgi:hypothetical protein
MAMCGIARVVGVLVATGLWLAGSAGSARAEAPPPGSVPLVCDRTGTIRAEGKSYYIDGAQVIPRSAEVTLQLGVTVVGINNASLDVQGGFKAHGTEDIWVTIRNVDFSPTTSPLKGVHLDMVDLVGCKWVHGETAGMDGTFTIENSCFQRDSTFNVCLRGGFLKIMTVEFGMPCRIRCVRQKENPVPIEVDVRSSWMKEIEISGPAVANFRHSEIKGGLVLKNVTDVMVDGCDISQKLAFHQAPDDSVKKIELTKVNFFDGARLVLERKKGPDTKTDKLKLDKPYFGTSGDVAVVDDKGIAGLIDDAEDDPEGSIKVWWSKANKRKHLLVNYDTLRSRAPPMK